MSTAPKAIKLPKGYRKLAATDNLQRHQAAGTLDELCRCSHLRSQHGPSPFGTPGQGKCAKCQCSQFTWVNWLVKK